MERPFGIVMRVACLIAGLACLWPAMLVANIAGALAVAALLIWNIKSAESLSLADTGHIEATRRVTD